ncbi:MAG: hydrogenase maturation protease [Rhodocyclaceae bacterium]|nr:MAG: hydrogenase maturation protease [Rhodocyclaceae bacterium]
MAPVLVFGWGNPSRGDDALGPLFVEAIEALALPGVECLTDFQLQVEHALDLAGRRRVLFVDASVDAAAPYTVEALTPARDATFSSHAMSPRAVLQAWADLGNPLPEEVKLLAIRGESFELGDGLTPGAKEHLQQAIGFVEKWLRAVALG